MSWEEEDQGASLAGVRGGDVEVVDCGHGGGDFAEVVCAGWDGWGGGVDGDDEMWEFPVTVEVCWAAW